jgi:D-serine deaminase-like pyridoxal phosphate-dependent protein
MTHPTLQNIPTPALVVDLARVKRNIDKLARYTRQHRINFRPHTKTHKSRLMARLQMEAGAGGLCVAKVGEAEVMAQESNDLLLAYPALDPVRACRVAELARNTTMHVAVDSRQAIDALAAAARAKGTTIGILPDIDVGMGRTGVQTPAEALELAQHADRTLGVSLDGLFCYPGHINVPAVEQAGPLAKVAAILQETLDLYKKAGLAAPIVSGGSSPTCYQSHLVPQYTEIRPGTNIYNDTNQAKAGFEKWEDCAATILCTVVSTAVPNQCVLDAGNKTLTSDRYFRDPDHAGHGAIVEYPGCKITRLSEEHGQVDLSPITDPAGRPQLGDRVHVIPNHICPCVNLHNSGWLLLEDGQIEPLAIDARGMIV